MPHRNYSEAVEAKAEALAYAIQVSRLSGNSGDAERRLRRQSTVQTLAQADCYWMATDIWQAICAGAESLPLDFAFRETLPLTTFGWIWLERPWGLPIDERNEDKELREEWRDLARSVSAITWGVGQGIREGDTVLAIETYHRAVTGQLMPVYMTFTREGISIAHEEERRQAELIAKARTDHVVALHMLMRVILSTLLWLKQRICVSRAVPLERHYRKRLSDVDMVKSLNVITLRQSERTTQEPDATGQAVEWSCRWLVRGHWRQQYHPSTGGHEPIFILPYVKGPEDKPLKPPSDTVFAVTR